jgi:hypothetical protein
MYLISVCNSRAEAARLLTWSASDGIASVDLPVPGLSGVTGIAAVGDHYVCCLQGTPARLLVLDRAFKVRDVHVYDELGDLHGIAPWGEGLAVVSSGTNQIVAIDADFRIVELLACDGSLVDRDHLNDICRMGERLVACRFGPRRREGRRIGAVFDVATGAVLCDGLPAPHSVVVDTGAVHVLESVTGVLLRLDPLFGPRPVLSVVGYARGLWMDEERIVVGKSAPRATGRKSRARSAARLMPDSLAGGDMDAAGFYVYDRGSGDGTFVSIEGFGSEIYQILAIA